MSPRNRWILIWVAFFILRPLSPGTIWAKDPPWHQKNFFIRFYQDHISGADGGRCPMYPSCSEYAARAIKKHGMAMGWIMTCDRLVRCGRDEVEISPKIQIKKENFVYDPVSANDFWWFTPPQKTQPEPPLK